MARERKKKEFVEPEQFQLTSLIDCVFLLLIFFMVTTVFKNPSALQMKLPIAEYSSLTEERKLVTEIDAEGKLALNGKRVYLDSYDSQLAREKDLKSSNTLIIQADENAKHGQILAAMKMAKAVGIETIVMATDEPMEAGATSR